MTKTKSLYGRQWPIDAADLSIVMYCIQKGGLFTHEKTGAECGAPLNVLYEHMRKILWPRLDDHRWHRLCRDTILENKVTCLVGAASTGKSHEAAWLFLCEYFCFPEETCVLVSSTDIRGLKLRIWAEISMLWEEAVQKYDFLPGHMLDSRIAITTDSLEDGDVGDRVIRDHRKGLIGIPTISGGKWVGLNKWIGVKQKRMRLIADEAQCFPVGTLVDTPTGPRAIETIQAGDYVINALGVSKVKRTLKRASRQMVKIQTRDGRTIHCTQTHPIFTQKGWVCACELNQSHYMVSAYEAMRVLREGIQASQSKHCVPTVQGKVNQHSMQTMRGDFSKGQHQQQGNVLFSELFGEMDANRPRISEKVLHQKEIGQNSSNAQSYVCGSPRDIRSNARQANRVNGAIYELAHAGATSNPPGKYKSDFEGYGSQTSGSWRQWDGANPIRKSSNEAVPRWDIQLSDSDGDEKWEWLSDVLQGGLGLSNDKAGHRGGQSYAPNDFPERARREEDSIPCGSWVDSVEIYEQENSDRYGKRDGGIEVYNLEIEGHPSYSVNGFLVHNCMGPSFLSAFSNLNKNEDFRAIVLGNPNDILDPLGKAAEPLDGWANHMEPDKTSVWETRFMNGKCVNLIGTDSPNFDYPADQPTRYKYLISREKIAETLSFFPKDSFEYYGQCVGSMRIGTLARRVLTRKMCEVNGALEKHINWEGSPRTKVYFVDSAYGGDRCVGGWIEFGKAVDGKVKILVHPPVIIPISVKSDKDPEFQIAEFVKRECEGLGIAPENMGHDSTGRGSLGTAIARVWSPMTNPIEFGGKPSDRPVSLDHFINDPKTNVRRLKLCSEHYVKKVTELWFSVRYAVEAGQIVGLPEDVMEEFCMREWNNVKDDKKEIETKEEMKERVGRSPDLADFLSGALEMARRRGFTISKLANEEESTRSLSWLDDAWKEKKKLLASKELTFA